ncbi:hypothetical protein P3S67_028845 [Capsicum chacoense]
MGYQPGILRYSNALCSEDFSARRGDWKKAGPQESIVCSLNNKDFSKMHKHTYRLWIYCVRSLWRWNKPLCEEPDLWGWNSLHYAVKLGLDDIVSDMLGWKKSLVYLPAGSENDWTTAIHIAASEGDINMINELLKHCPDCWDMLNSNSQNALHVAILNNQEAVVRFLLNSERCESFVDETDSDGNTPLHLLAVSGNHVPELINHPRAKKMPFNKENKTPLDLALLCTVTTKKEKLVDDLCKIGRFGQRDFEVKRKYKYMPNACDEAGTRGNMINLPEKDDADKQKKTMVENIMMAAQMQIVVATLIMTVTFAAGFTLPGGFESDSPNKGMAILIRKTAFRAFVVSNAIGFTCSSVAIFIYFLMAEQSRHPSSSSTVKKLYDVAGILQFLSMLAVVIAFATGMFATLAHSLGLAVTVPLMEGLITIGVDCHGHWVEKSNRYVWHWKEGEILETIAMTVQSDISYDDFVHQLLWTELSIGRICHQLHDCVKGVEKTRENETQNVEEEEKEDFFDDRLDDLDMNIPDDDQTHTLVDATNMMCSSSQSTQSGNLQDDRTGFFIGMSFKDKNELSNTLFISCVKKDFRIKKSDPGGESVEEGG